MADRNTGNWTQLLGPTQEVWAETTTFQLLKPDGHEQELTRLVVKTCAISRQEADRQVIAFVGRRMY